MISMQLHYLLIWFAAEFGCFALFLGGVAALLTSYDRICAIGMSVGAVAGGVFALVAAGLQ